MREKVDVLVIGGSASGIVAATTGKSNYPDKDFMVIRKEKQVVVPCGIPYIFGSLENTEKNLMPDTILENAGIKIKIGEIISINQKDKNCKTSDGDYINFKKLIIATGSKAKNPPWLKGSNKQNVFTIPKDKNYLDDTLIKLNKCKKIVTIGGGFIGVEVSDELNKIGKDVTIIELLPNVLNLAFDKEIAIKAEEILKKRGIKIITNIGVKEILGDKKLSAVLLENGEKINADAVILSIGYYPNTDLAKKAGLPINEKGFIKVDEYMRTENPDIMVVGDSAEKRDFITRKISNVMLASTACVESRIAGMNLYKLSSLKTFNGTIAIFSTVIGDSCFGVAGLTENCANKENFEIVTGSFEGVDKHPGSLNGTNKQYVKLIVAKESGLILGGEVIGGPSAGELTNIIGFLIQNKMTINSLLTSQIGTHPLATAPPTSYPLIKAAEMALNKL